MQPIGSIDINEKAVPQRTVFFFFNVMLTLNLFQGKHPDRREIPSNAGLDPS